MAVMPPTHALARRKKLLWPDLSGQSLITLQGQFTELLVSDVGEAARDMHKEAFMQVTYMTTALALARAGLGITLCMPYARTLVEQFGLVMRPVGHPVVERSFWVFTRRGRALAAGRNSAHFWRINCSPRVCARVCRYAFPVASTTTELVPRAGIE